MFFLTIDENCAIRLLHSDLLSLEDKENWGLQEWKKSSKREASAFIGGRMRNCFILEAMESKDGADDVIKYLEKLINKKNFKKEDIIPLFPSAVQEGRHHFAPLNTIVTEEEQVKNKPVASPSPLPEAPKRSKPAPSTPLTPQLSIPCNCFKNYLI